MGSLFVVPGLTRYWTAAAFRLKIQLQQVHRTRDRLVLVDSDWLITP